jgi:hypothetical protein
MAMLCGNLIFLITTGSRFFSGYFRNIKELAVHMKELTKDQWLERQFFNFQK